MRRDELEAWLGSGCGWLAEQPHHHHPPHLGPANWQLISRIDSVVRSQVPHPPTPSSLGSFDLDIPHSATVIIRFHCAVSLQRFSKYISHILARIPGLSCHHNSLLMKKHLSMYRIYSASMSTFSPHHENTFTWVYISVHAAIPMLGAELSGVINSRSTC